MEHHAPEHYLGMKLQEIKQSEFTGYLKDPTKHEITKTIERSIEAYKRKNPGVKVENLELNPLDESQPRDTNFIGKLEIYKDPPLNEKTKLSLVWKLGTEIFDALYDKNFDFRLEGEHGQDKHRFNSEIQQYIITITFVVMKDETQ